MLHAVIMAGGSGKRFWPQSRQRRPKHVLAIASARPMIVETVLRLRGLVPIERTCIVTAAAQVAAIRRCLRGGPQPRLIAEPCGRDTAACIGLAALHVLKRDPQGIMLAMPADQVIAPAERFRAVMSAGVEVVRDSDALVTFGVKADRPATGYGYVHRGRRVTTVRGIPVYDVRRFHEKPPHATASRYVASGQWYWNSGIFCWRASTILECLRRFKPGLYAALQRIGGAIGTPREKAVLREAYGGLKRSRKGSIDYVVMERAEGIRVVEADFAWSDVGSWASVARLRRREADRLGNLLVGRCEAFDAADSVVIGDDRHLVALVGLQGVIVVHTPDATLVCSKGHAERVKELVERLEKKGLERYL